ncbi:ABC transporter substrate-binding protein [Nocardia sp. NPDC052278]|uniref:ABC transporter substrate-binding protein n=1 Tax=unclassified Nocardia TaxID=2637762 RepID=UPI0036AB1936
MSPVPAHSHRIGRLLAVVVALGLAVSGCATFGNRDGGAVTVSATAGSIPGLPPIVAKETGIFARYGINATLITSLRGGAAVISALSSGSVDVAAQTVSGSAQAKQQGASLPMISAQSAGVPYLLVVGGKRAGTPKASPGADNWQATIRALKGATVAASGPGTAFDVILKALFTDAGLAPTDFANVNVAHGGGEIAALQSGQVDAVFADIGTALSLQAKAGGHEVFDMTADGPQWLTEQAWSGNLSSQRYLDSHPDFAVRWEAAMDETRRYFQDPANLPELHRIAVQVSGIPDDSQLDAALTRFAALLRARFTPAQVQATIDYMTRTGQLDAKTKLVPADLVLPNVLTIDK